MSHAAMPGFRVVCIGQPKGSVHTPSHHCSKRTEKRRSRWGSALRSGHGTFARLRPVKPASPHALKATDGPRVRSEKILRTALRKS